MMKDIDIKYLASILSILVISISVLSLEYNLSYPVYAQSSIPDFNIAAAGDWGCTSNTDATVSSIANTNPELVLGLGDYSYVTGTDGAECWLDLVDPIDNEFDVTPPNNVPRMEINIGNHENTASEGLNGYLNNFQMTNQYHAFTYNAVHFISMATDVTFTSGSAQYNFILNELQQASTNPDIKWIIVFAHRPHYDLECSSSACDGSTSFRNTYHPLFDQYGVDLVLLGHAHNYQRSFPINYNPNSNSNPIITDNNPNTYNNPSGHIFVVSGAGGVGFQSLSGSENYIPVSQAQKFGHLNLDFTNNGKILTGKFIANDGQIMDQFTITKTPVEICGNGIDDDEDTFTDEGCYNYAPFFTLTGSNNLDVPSTPSLKLTQFTAAAWFKTSSTFSSDAFIANKGGIGSESSGQNQNYGLWFTTSEQLRGGFETSSGSNRFVTSTPSFNDGQWHHGVVTYDGSVIRLYVDGVQITTLSTTSNPDNTGNQPLRIGANSRVLSDFFVGNVDEVGVWNRALTQTEIDNLRNNGVFAPSGLVYSNSFGIPTEICNDNIDNDNDGKIDAEDLDCPAVPEICNNGLDDDRDGFKDLQDTDCQQTTGYHYAPFFTANGGNVLDIPDASNLKLTQFTVATWFKTTANFPDEGVMVNKGGLGSESAGANQNYGIWFTPSETLQGGFETTGGSNRYVTSTNDYNDGQWHHGVVTYNGANVVLYVDGVQIGTLATTSTPDNTGNQPLRIAGNAQSLVEDLFVGDLDEVGVWNRTLSITEITNLMNFGVFALNGLVYSNSFGTTVSSISSELNANNNMNKSATMSSESEVNANNNVNKLEDPFLLPFSEKIACHQIDPDNPPFLLPFTEKDC